MILLVIAASMISLAYASAESLNNAQDEQNIGSAQVEATSCRITSLVYWVNGVKKPEIPITPAKTSINVNIKKGDTVQIKVKCTGGTTKAGYAFIRDPVLGFHQSILVPKGKSVWCKSTQSFFYESAGDYAIWLDAGNNGINWANDPMDWHNLIFHVS